MPVGEYMFNSLKSNKSIMLDKTKRFRRTLGGYGLVDKEPFGSVEATPQLLRDIRYRLKMERRQLLWKRIILLLTIFIILLAIIVS